MLGASNTSTSPSPMDIIQQECEILLATATSSVDPKLSKVEYIPKNLESRFHIFNKPLPCQGRFLQCKHDELTDTDVKLLFEKLPASAESKSNHLVIPLTNERQSTIGIQPDADPDTAAFTRKATYVVDTPMAKRKQQVDDDPNLLKQFYNQAASTSRDSRLKLTKKTDPQPVNKWMKTDYNDRHTSPPIAPNVFKTARHELVVNQAKRCGLAATSFESQQNLIDGRRNVRSKYVPVMQKAHQNPTYK